MVLSPGTGSVVPDLLSSSVILAEDWGNLSLETQSEVEKCFDRRSVLNRLIELGLMTEYQAARIEAGTSFGLMLGNYRVLDRLGAGGMGTVFLAEHVRMRRLAAVKVLALSPERDSKLLLRFLSEMRAVAQLQHPNIVSAMDDGSVPAPDAHTPALHYFVMEYVPGQDLEEAVRAQGPLTVAKACGVVYQIAGALAEAHKHKLVHRDVKPANIRVTPEGRAKLLDFGLVRHFRSQVTEPGTTLGTLDYLAPEQVWDATAVDIRADVYGLGGTLFWCLTGRPPFPAEGTVAQILTRRRVQQPPVLSAWRPDVPAGLAAVVARMLACHPNDRYPTPQAVMNALLGFLQPESREQVLTPAIVSQREPGFMPDPHPVQGGRVHRVLIVDDSATIRQFCSTTLQAEGMLCDEAEDGRQALEAIGSKPYDLVVTDWVMPEMTGLELCQKLRQNPPWPHLKIILFSAQVTDDEVAEVLSAGADDYLNKAFSPVQLVARVKAALHLKDVQDRTELLNQRLLAINHQLEQNLTARDNDLFHIRSALVLGLAELGSQRDVETMSHLVRLQRYCRCLAEAAAGLAGFADRIDEQFIQMLECCAPLHDIGKASLPDHILGKPGLLDAEERLLMQTHTVSGAATLQRVAQRHGQAVAFLQMAIDIARHHHERYDGTGYPDGLAGGDIPLAARIVAVGDAYDSMRCRQLYKPALSHGAAMEIIVKASPGHFDPLLLQALQAVAAQFERIFHELPEAA